MNEITEALNNLGFGESITVKIKINDFDDYKIFVEDENDNERSYT